MTMAKPTFIAMSARPRGPVVCPAIIAVPGTIVMRGARH